MTATFKLVSENKKVAKETAMRSNQEGIPGRAVACATGEARVLSVTGVVPNKVYPVRPRTQSIGILDVSPIV